MDDKKKLNGHACLSGYQPVGGEFSRSLALSDRPPLSGDCAGCGYVPRPDCNGEGQLALKPTGFTECPHRAHRLLAMRVPHPVTL